MSVESKRVIVGTHEFQFVAPDQLRFFLRDEFSDSDCIAYVDFVFQDDPNRAPVLYSIYDLTKMTRVAEAARKRVINVNRPYPYGGMAVMTSNFTTRALVGMVMRAGKLIAPERLSFPYKFVDSIDEANAWFDELRKKQG